MNVLAHEAYFSLILSGVSIFIWSLLLARAINMNAHQKERRSGSAMAMYVTGLIASIGFFAAAWSFAIREGLPVLVVPLEFTAFISSVGRGALFMGGLLLLASQMGHKR